MSEYKYCPYEGDFLPVTTSQEQQNTNSIMQLEKQRIAIAEFCGWKNIYLNYVPWKHQYDKFLVGDSPNNTVSRSLVLDYHHDLNAMHEAEKMFDTDENLRNRYRFYLGETLRVKTDADGWRVVRATAAQRAEAFLRTIGKWEETAS